MKKVYQAQILRVFVDANKNFGNLASVVLDEGKKIEPAFRQQLTQKLGHDETVFVNDMQTGNVSIYNPQREVRFAGHAMVGTAWLLKKNLGSKLKIIHCLAGDIEVWQDGELTWARAGLTMMPPWRYRQLENVPDVENISLNDTRKLQHTFVWAWIDEVKGIVRARTFAPDWGIPESEGNGSGSMLLAARLKHKLEIKHGKGSIIYANIAANHQADIGGRVVQEPTQNIEIG